MRREYCFKCPKSLFIPRQFACGFGQDHSMVLCHKHNGISLSTCDSSKIAIALRRQILLLQELS